MDKEKPVERFLPLRPVEFDVLLSLASGERHGYGIIQDSGTRGIAAPPDVGTLYRALARMLEQKLIQESTRREAPDAGNERRNTTGSLRSASGWHRPKPAGWRR